MEARGEDAAGQEAVTHVINNRLRHGGFGKTAAAVCLAKDQFSCWNTGDVNINYGQGDIWNDQVQP